MSNSMQRSAVGLRTLGAKLSLFLEQHARPALLLFGGVLLVVGLSQVCSAQGGGPTGSYSEANFEDDLIRNSVGNLLKLVEGAFGALLMVVAGLAAIIAAAIGAYRTAMGMLVVAVGAFILRALVSLFFGTDYEDFAVG